MSSAYVFDLDGTLVDTAPDLLAVINIVMAREGRRAIATDEIRRLVGRGVKVLIEKAFKETGTPVDPARLDGLFDTYLALYEQHLTDTSRPYPGVMETLTRLKAAGSPLAVLTNKPHALAEKLLLGLGMRSLFGAVFGAGKMPYLKPDARIFADVRRELAWTGPAVMVGDSITDVQTARNAGVPVVLVSYGYTPEPAANLGADAVVDDFSAVPAAVGKLPGFSGGA
jgi:phosphoglycolate phosphatase